MASSSSRIRLSGEEINKVRAIIKKGSHNARVINRAHVLVCAHEGMGTRATAQTLDTSRSVAQSVRKHYREHGIDRALYDAPRPGQPKKVTDKVEADLVALACTKAPEGHAWWTLELLRNELIKKKKLKTVSTVCLWHHLDRRGLKPWREKNVVRSEAHA
jgi:putative transposase